MVVVSFRNGFGFDAEVVDTQPVWGWKDGEDPDEDIPDVFVFEGIVFNLPFLKVMWGKVYSPD